MRGEDDDREVRGLFAVCPFQDVQQLYGALDEGEGARGRAPGVPSGRPPGGTGVLRRFPGLDAVRGGSAALPGYPQEAAGGSSRRLPGRATGPVW
nr:hypothetical protein [Streptomyces chrestomyceticus]